MRTVRDAKLFPLGLIVLMLNLGLVGLAQTNLHPGFNLFSPEQDIEIGRQSAQEAEKQLPILRASRVEAYVQRIGKRLAKHVQGYDYPYQFKLVNDPAVNAFALPGGFMYINRGLIEEVDNEAELAGVMAHEMAHVALRHGTNQASKAYLAQAGLGILGGLLGGGNSSQIIQSLGGFGLNTLFLKFSRSAEQKADILGAQTLAAAGYDPMAMVAFFEELQSKSGGNPSKFEQFFSSHPAPANRAQRVREEVGLLGHFDLTGNVGDLKRMQARLDRLPEAPTRQRAAEGRNGSGNSDLNIENPSSRFRTYTGANNFVQISYPENWHVYESRAGVGLTMTPDGGLVNRNGRQEIVEGFILNHYEPFGDGSSAYPFRDPNRIDHLRLATEDLAHQFLSSNSYLEIEENSWRRDQIEGRAADSVILSGLSPVTGEYERVSLYTRSLPDGHVLYMVFIAPENRYRILQATFDRMLSSLKVNDEYSHAQ